jgi:UrcA family protein
MRIIQETVLALALTGALSAGATTALAGAAVRHTLDPAVTVRFADLNLNNAEGARTLYGRIRNAAQTVCGPRYSLWDGRSARAWQECYRKTIDEAVTQVNRPKLTALHLRMTPAKPG